QQVLLLDEVEDRHDVRVRPFAEDARLAGEAAADLAVSCEVGVETLDGHLAIERLVVAAIDDPHAPFADDRLDTVDGERRPRLEAHGREAGARASFGVAIE